MTNSKNKSEGVADSTIRPGYYTRTKAPTWAYFVPETGHRHARYAQSNGYEADAYFASHGRTEPDLGPITYAEARAILGDKWPASWPQSEGVAEPTAAPATGHAGAGVRASAPSDSSDAATIAELREAVAVLAEYAGAAHGLGGRFKCWDSRRLIDAHERAEANPIASAAIAARRQG